MAYLKAGTETKAVENSVNKSERSGRASLRQNFPNPANQTTTIEYTLPDEATHAALYVFDLSGRQVAAYDQLKRGDGSVTISAAQLNPGLYHYSLVVDGNIVDTKKMILTSK